MASELAYVYLSVAAVSLIAVVGIVTMSVDPDRLTELVSYLVSFSAGTLFGDAFFHLLPETVDAHGFDATTGAYVLGGLGLALVVEKYISWHHHHHPREGQPSSLSYMILLGDAVHNVIDGVIIAASYLSSIPLGIATTAAIATHEVPQEIGDFGVLVYGGVPRGRAIAYNVLTALSAFAGATVVLILAGDAGELTEVLLPVAAGNFIYIAGSDLLPEVVKEPDDRRAALQLVTFVIGIGLLYLLAN